MLEASPVKLSPDTKTSKLWSLGFAVTCVEEKARNSSPEISVKQESPILESAFEELGNENTMDGSGASSTAHGGGCQHIEWDLQERLHNGPYGNKKATTVPQGLP